MKSPMILKFSTGIYHISSDGKNTYCNSRIDFVVDQVFTKTWADVPALRKCHHCDRMAAKIAKAQEMPEARRHAQDMEKLKAWVKAVKP